MPVRALAPQASASANSATRTRLRQGRRAVTRLARWGTGSGPPEGCGRGVAEVLPWRVPGGWVTRWASASVYGGPVSTTNTAGAAGTAPAAEDEVVGICRDLL